MSDSIIHYNAIRTRVAGSGNLELRFRRLDETVSEELMDITMEANPTRLPIRLSNCKEQRVQVEFKVTELDSYFDINKITIYAKALWAEYPG